MVTIYLRYVLNTARLAEFEHYGKLWIPLVEKFGGKHHGYFLPSEGADNIALALFTFESLAAYEIYRQRSFEDADCKAAFKLRGRHAMRSQLRTQLFQAGIWVIGTGR